MAPAQASAGCRARRRRRQAVRWCSGERCPCPAIAGRLTCRELALCSPCLLPVPARGKPSPGRAWRCRRRVRRSGVRRRDARRGAVGAPNFLTRLLPRRPESPACGRRTRTAAARGEALPAAQLASDRRCALLDKPNNNLAVRYCRAVTRPCASDGNIPAPAMNHVKGAPLPRAVRRFQRIRKLWAGERAGRRRCPFEPDLPIGRLTAGQYTGFSAAGRCRLAPSPGPACRGKRPLRTSAASRGTGAPSGSRSPYQHHHRRTSRPLSPTVRTSPGADARLMDAALRAAPPTVSPPAAYLHLLGGRMLFAFLPHTALLAGPSAGMNDTLARMAEAQLAAADFGTLCRVSPRGHGRSTSSKISFDMCKFFCKFYHSALVCRGGFGVLW